MIIRYFRKPPPPWEWPGDLGRYADLGPHFAVVLRIAQNTTDKTNHHDPLPLPEGLWMNAYYQVPLRARYMDMALANAGVMNFMVKGRPAVRDLTS